MVKPAFQKKSESRFFDGCQANPYFAADGQEAAAAGFLRGLLLRWCPALFFSTLESATTTAWAGVAGALFRGLRL